MNRKKSIRGKLLKGILMINSLIIIGIIIFSLNFENFYIRNIGEELNSFGVLVKNKVAYGLDESLEDEILKSSRDKGVIVEIFNENDELSFTTKPMGNGMSKHKNSIGMCSIDKEYSLNNGEKAYLTYERSENIEFLTAIVDGDNDKYTVMVKIPINAIKNSVNIALKFLIIIFVPIMIFSVLVAIYFSKKFTNPILKLNRITDKIAKLNFEEKVNINTGDEIEDLGESINELSVKINEAFEELKEKNINLKELIEKQRKEEKLKREFVSSVSHELKTPITVINGYAEGLRSGIVEEKEDTDFYVDVICEESEKMGVLVKDLLELYKLESKSFSLKKEKVSIREVIQSTLNSFELRFKSEDVEVETNVEDILIMGDKIRIGQVLNNFIDNALCHVNDEKKIKIESLVNESNVRIAIFNSGEHIREAELENIWYSFARGSKVRSSNENRVGLGLAIVREIMNLHNGRYGVANKEYGVEFWVEFNLEK
ncbi:histidine kinase dimerization/phospho-acceptor domain-containing protein [Clostridium sp. B9]